MRDQNKILGMGAQLNFIEWQFRVSMCKIDVGSTPGNRVPLTLHAKWPCVKRNFHAYKATGHLKLGLVLKMKTLALQQT